VTKSSARPAIKVDCSDWGREAAVTLELILGLDPTENALELESGLSNLVGAVNQLDRRLGGTGLSRVAARQSNGTLILSLAPENNLEAAARMRRLCNTLNQVTMPPELTLPAFITSIMARIA